MFKSIWFILCLCKSHEVFTHYNALTSLRPREDTVFIDIEVNPQNFLYYEDELPLKPEKQSSFYNYFQYPFHFFFTLKIPTPRHTELRLNCKKFASYFFFRFRDRRCGMRTRWMEARFQKIKIMIFLSETKEQN